MARSGRQEHASTFGGGLTMITRISILSAFLLLGAAYVATASKTESIPPRESLSHFPDVIAEWRGRPGPEFDQEILDVLGVDEYVSRVYTTDTADAVGLYIGYYQSQRQGDTIHSPMNCLPGSGWEPVSRTYIDIPVQAGTAQHTINVNRYLIRKGLDEQVVLYWYQSHGRAIANEYRSKILMVYDAVRLNRTDAALVRIVSPKVRNEKDSELRAIDFVRAIYPLLGKYIPS
jgi:EpsI family protein